MWDESDWDNLMSTPWMTERNLYLYAHCCCDVKGPGLEMVVFLPVFSRRTVLCLHDDTLNTLRQAGERQKQWDVVH